MYARCAICHQPLAGVSQPGTGPQTCRRCERESVVTALPALFVNPSAQPPSLPADPPGEGEAACFHSPNRKATKACSHCGVLISDIWAARWGSDVVCLKCLDRLREQGRDQRFEKKRVLWDNVALALALTPFTLVLYWAALFTAPASFFISLRFWKGPFSMIPRGRTRMAAALLLSFLQVGGMIAVVVAIFFQMDWLKKL